MSSLLSDTKALLAKLVSFDTISAKTNLPCAEFIRDYLAGHEPDMVLAADALNVTPDRLAAAREELAV